MFTVWICIECLHRILKGELLWTKRPSSYVSSAENLRKRSVKKTKKTFCVKNNVWTTNVFKPWLCDDGRVLFLHLFLIVIFISFHRLGDVNVLSSDSSVVSFFLSPVLSVVLLMSKPDWAWWVKKKVRLQSCLAVYKSNSVTELDSKLHCVGHKVNTNLCPVYVWITDMFSKRANGGFWRILARCLFLFLSVLSVKHLRVDMKFTPF